MIQITRQLSFGNENSDAEISRVLTQVHFRCVMTGTTSSFHDSLLLVSLSLSFAMGRSFIALMIFCVIPFGVNLNAVGETTFVVEGLSFRCSSCKRLTRGLCEVPLRGVVIVRECKGAGEVLLSQLDLSSYAGAFPSPKELAGYLGSHPTLDAGLRTAIERAIARAMSRPVSAMSSPANTPRSLFNESRAQLLLPVLSPEKPRIEKPQWSFRTPVVLAAMALTLGILGVKGCSFWRERRVISDGKLAQALSAFQLSPNCTRAELRHAFRAQVKRVHPDVVTDGAGEALQVLVTQYRLAEALLLARDQRRRRYEREEP